MLDRILVPLDGSETAEAVLPHLKPLLRRHDGQLILLRVAIPPPVEAQGVMMIDSFVADARTYLARIREPLEKEGVRVQVEVRVGPPARSILDLVEEEEVTLVAMATHGRTGLPRILLGSVAEEVIRKCPVPVWVVRPFAPPQGPPPEGVQERVLRNILVPTDPGRSWMGDLGPAIEMAKLFDARLILLHILDPEKEATGESPREVEERSRKRLESMAGELEADGVRTLTLLERGDVSKSILDAARFHECDLIAITTRGRGGLARWVAGSVTEEVLRQTGIPLLVVSTRGKRREKAKHGARAPGRSTASGRS